jgi:peptide/nickel transport system substrate-binding protein
VKRLALAALLLLVSASLAPGQSSPSGATPGTGGWLNLRLREDLPQGFSIHESPTISTMWPAMPCLSNLVLFDPLKTTHTAESVIGELAEKWSWQDNYRNLVFFLRADVKWHDGRPFTSRDVTYTFDLLREAPEAPKLRLNPRRDWWANVASVEAVDARTVIFRLKRPQPSLLLLLASGFTPIYAAHVPVATYRTGCIGTGPFKLKEWRRGEFVEYVKNPDYFIKGRPYLDGLRYQVIRERSTAMAALQTRRVDVPFPGDTSKTMADQLKRAVPSLVVTPVGTAVVDHLLINTTRPPFDNAKVRKAMDHAIDRRALIETVYQGGAVAGAAMAPKPLGVWGLLDTEVRALPGSGRPTEEKAKARALLAEAGFNAGHPLKLELQTRGLPAFLDLASFLATELKGAGVEVTVKQVETTLWEPQKIRREFLFGADRTSMEPDDPDATFYEHYACGSPRAYGGYCDPEITRLIEQQSQELDRAKRLALVQTIQRKLAEAAVSPILCWRLDYFTLWPYVRSLVPHHSLYGWGRMQDVWLDPALTPRS